MYTYKGKTALVTGASSGIGVEFARALAERGMHLILVARREDRLKTLATELENKYSIKVEVLAADLSQPGIANSLYQETQKRGLAVDMLVNNAGFSTFGDFETISAEHEQAEILVNVATLVDLTHVFVPAMLTKGDGAVINTASVGGFTPIARQAVYAATKAFVLSFSEALWVEYRQRGVRVFALCPGGVSTEFADVIDVSVNMAALMATPEWVVAAGLKAFERGKHFVIPGTINYIYAGILPRLLPRGLFVRLFSYFAKIVLRQNTQPSVITAKN